MAVPTVTDVTAPTVAEFGVPFPVTVDAISGLPTVAVPLEAVAVSSLGEESQPWPFTVTASEPLRYVVRSTDAGVIVAQGAAGNEFSLTINS